MTVGSAFTSSNRRFAQYKGAARFRPDGLQWKRKTNNPRNAKDSQGTERPLRVLLLLFPQGKRRPRRRRGGKGKRRREPPPPRRGGMKHPSTKKEEKRRCGPPGCRFKWGRPAGAAEKLFSPLYHTPYPPPICKNRQKTARKFYHSGEKEKFPEMVRT